MLLQVKDIDQYGRNVAACSLKAPTPGAKGEDINAYMVQNGHATAYRWAGAVLSHPITGCHMGLELHAKL